MESNAKNSLQNIFRLGGIIFLLLLILDFLSYEYNYDSVGEAISLLIAFGLALAYFLLNQYVIRPIIEINQFAHKIKEGKHDSRLNYNSENEIGELAQTILEMNQYIGQATFFVKQIAEGNLESEQELAKFGNKQDNLAQALIQMRDQMKVFSELERQRNWITAGIAQFVEILRTDHQDLDKLYELIIAQLVKYLQANQGALFIYETFEDKMHLSMKSCYAYDRRKYLNKTIQAGEGLLGQAILEKKSIYLTDVPKGYLEINSGLGSTDPKSIIILPLLTNEKVYGAIEIASLNEIQPYQIEFLEKIGDNIASTIGGIINSEENRKLLEELQEQSEEMRAQDEEMRQNLEELMATQEEMRRRQEEAEELNRKLIANEQVLKRVLEKQRQQEAQNRAIAEEKIIRLQDANALAEKKQEEMEIIHQKLVQNEMVLQEAITKNQEKEKAYKAKIAELEQQLAQLSEKK